MPEVGPRTSRRTRTGNSYVSQWNRFVTWSEASGRLSLPASPEDVAAYLEDRSEMGARPSTLRVVTAAIARNHRDAGFDVPLHRGVARTVLEELTREDSPVRPGRSLWTWTAISPSGRWRTDPAGEGAAGWSAPRAPAGGAL